MLLKDRVAIVTGGAGFNGLGFATARMLAAHGADVVITDLAAANPAAAAELGAQHLGLVADVTNAEQCQAAAAAALAHYGRIDILFNNAGITQARKTLDISPSDYDAVLDVSLRGTLLMSQAVLPAMQRQQGGSIISTSSVSAQRGGGILGGPHYSAAKAGVLGLTRAMAREFGPDNIRVNATPYPRAPTCMQPRPGPGHVTAAPSAWHATSPVSAAASAASWPVSSTASDGWTTTIRVAITESGSGQASRHNFES
jgi:NAD(P)-dependent dehydrogenase (short-subunit alcohol dehydrogenase family)